MTKQEEIREGIKGVLFENGVSNKRHITRLIVDYLHSQGVVIKKEFVPPYLPSVIEREKQILAIVEPLIEVEDAVK